ncbi:MAG TPA: hypothetical protein DD725_04320 [Deltaproteobacteria bacterium]|nr:hypothetical protein [Deltaproteobacteria bacterium]HLA50566.1 hypothetical protein [Thermodesulfovibrionia bacterium]
MTEFLSVKQAIEYLASKGLELKPGTLRRKIQKREIPYYALGRPKLKRNDLDNWIESRHTRARIWPGRRV